MPPRPKSSNKKKAEVHTYFNARNAPIIGACVLLAFGVILAIMPSSRPSPAARAGFEQAEQGHPPQLQKAVEAIHAARDKPDFTAEVMLSIVHRFYRVLLGGPATVNSTTEWKSLSGAVFRVYGFAVDDATSKAAKAGGGDARAPPGQAFKKAVAEQIMMEAHIHMLARKGDTVFIDPETQFGAEYLSQRCAAYAKYGLTCAAWDTDAISAHIEELRADHAAQSEANDGALAAAGAAARPQLFVIGRTEKLNALGMWPDDASGRQHELKPLHAVPHLILLPPGPEQLQQQQREYEQQQRMLREQQEVKEQFATIRDDDEDDADDDDAADAKADAKPAAAAPAAAAPGSEEKAVDA